MPRQFARILRQSGFLAGSLKRDSAFIFSENRKPRFRVIFLAKPHGKPIDSGCVTPSQTPDCQLLRIPHFPRAPLVLSKRDLLRLIVSDSAVSMQRVQPVVKGFPQHGLVIPGNARRNVAPEFSPQSLFSFPIFTRHFHSPISEGPNSEIRQSQLLPALFSSRAGFAHCNEDARGLSDRGARKASHTPLFHSAAFRIFRNSAP